MLLQTLLAVLIEKELGISQTGTEHALISVLDGFKVFLSAIAYRDEERHQASVSSLDRKIPLMIAHRRNDCFRRKLQIFFFESSAQRCRILDKIQHLFQQIFCDLRCPAMFPGHGFDLFTNHRLSFVRIDNDRMFLTGCFIAAGIGNLKITAGQKTVPARYTAGPHFCHFKGNDLSAVKGDNPAQRTNKLKI